MPKFTNKLAGKKVVVIGGSSGIGFGVAEALASLDAHVIIISSSKNKVDNALSRLRNSASEISKIEGLSVSASDSNSIVEALKDLGPFDHLVYTAAQFSSLKSDDLDSLKSAFEVKFWGAVNAATAIAEHELIKRGGSIVLTSGTAGLTPKKNSAIRGALNGALISLTKGLAVDLADKGIRVNTVIPGLVETELWDSAGTSKDSLLLEAQKRLLVPFIGQPSDVAESYIYFLRADYSTGVTVVIDGGGLLA